MRAFTAAYSLVRTTHSRLVEAMQIHTEAMQIHTMMALQTSSRSLAKMLE